MPKIGLKSLSVKSSSRLVLARNGFDGLYSTSARVEESICVKMESI